MVVGVMQVQIAIDWSQSLKDKRRVVKSLRDTLDQCKNKLGSGVILLSAITDDKVALAAGVTADLTSRVKAGDLMREMAQRLGGKGGGRPDMAQGGGTDVAGLPEVLKSVPDWVASALR